MKFCITGSSRVFGIMPPGNATFVNGSIGRFAAATPEKSPFRRAGSSTGTPFTAASVLAAALIRGEEEGLVLEDRASEGAAELIPLQRSRFIVEEVVRVHRVIAQKLERRAVEPIGSRLA